MKMNTKNQLTDRNKEIFEICKEIENEEGFFTRKIISKKASIGTFRAGTILCKLERLGKIKCIGKPRENGIISKDVYPSSFIYTTC